MSLCLKPFHFSLVPRRSGRFALAATQVQQFNRVGVATTVGKGGRTGCECV